jgi:hypothetical protein
MSEVMPTLSTFGWVMNPLEKLDFALAHFFESDKLQTSIYGSNVTSFPWILEQHSHDVIQAADQVRSALNTYLSRYYDGANVDVKVTPENTTSPGSRMRMSLAVSVIDNGSEYQASRLALLSEGKLLQFINANNEDT